MSLLTFKPKHRWRDIDVDLSTSLPGSYMFNQPFTTSDRWTGMAVLTLELASRRLSEVQKDDNRAVMQVRLRY